MYQALAGGNLPAGQNKYLLGLKYLENDIDARPPRPLPRRKRPKPALFYIGVFVAVLFVPVFFVVSSFSDIPSPVTHASGSSAGYNANDAKVFANIPELRLALQYPADAEKIVAFAYHEANNRRAYPMIPTITPIATASSESEVKTAVSRSLSEAVKTHFIMNSRGRGQAPNSAVDVPVLEGTKIVSPVSGTVTLVKKYMLYGRIEDNHIEIAPDGVSGVRVAIIHIKNVKIKEGDKVIAGKTYLAEPRLLVKIGSQVERYLPKPFLHVHIQVNPHKAEPIRNSASANR